MRFGEKAIAADRHLQGGIFPARRRITRVERISRNLLRIASYAGNFTQMKTLASGVTGEGALSVRHHPLGELYKFMMR